jgi:hypothetical protein
LVEKLSAGAARRIALAAQGFAEPRPRGPVDQGHLRRLLDRIGLLQIDSVNVLARAHYLPLFARWGNYPRTLLDRAAWGEAPCLFEYWAHEASLLPLERQPLLRWRMARAEAGRGTWRRVAEFAGERRGEAEAMLARIAAGGPLAASDVEAEKGAKRVGGWWGWSDAKNALEWLFWAGRVTTLTRRGSFERVYDLTERVLPRAILDTPTPAEPEAHRALLGIAARALGVATAGDLGDYFRLGVKDAAPRLAELVEDGELTPVEVEGWRQPAYLHRHARPAAPDCRADRPGAVRSLDLGTVADRAAVRSPLPHRDLYPGRQASARLLRPSLPARRPDGGAGRPQGRPQSESAAGAGRPPRAGRAA